MSRICICIVLLRVVSELLAARYRLSRKFAYHNAWTRHATVDDVLHGGRDRTLMDNAHTLSVLGVGGGAVSSVDLIERRDFDNLCHGTLRQLWPSGQQRTTT